MNNKVLIVGFGEIAQRHYKNLNKLYPNYNYAVLTKKKLIKNKIKIFNSIKDAIKFKPFFTLICSPANTHIKYAKLFSNINSNLFIEKPVAVNKIEFLNFLNSIKKKKLTIMTGYNLRFDESFIFFKKKIKKSILGKILSVRSEVGQYLPNWRKKHYTKAVSSQKKLGGGVINELSHDIDILYSLFEKIKLVFSLNFKASDLKINVEDTLHAIFKSKFNGKDFYITLNMDFYRHDTTRRCLIIGSKATIEWDYVKREVRLIKKGNNSIKVYKFHKDKNRSYIKEISYFIKSIKNKITLKNSFRKNLDLIKILELLRKKK